jgi:hypothetical protein
LSGVSACRFFIRRYVFWESMKMSMPIDHSPPEDLAGV